MPVKYHERNHYSLDRFLYRRNRDHLRGAPRQLIEIQKTSEDIYTLWVEDEKRRVWVAYYDAEDGSTVSEDVAISVEEMSGYLKYENRQDFLARQVSWAKLPEPIRKALQEIRLPPVKEFEGKLNRQSAAQPYAFTENDPPSWLGPRGVPGSTMCNRWFWYDYILTLEVGGEQGHGLPNHNESEMRKQYIY